MVEINDNVSASALDLLGADGVPNVVERLANHLGKLLASATAADDSQGCVPGNCWIWMSKFAKGIVGGWSILVD
jgi:hypothetical protein